MRMNARFAWILVGAILMVDVAAGQQPAPSIGIVEKLGQTIPLDVEFYDESGQLALIKDLVNKPTIFTFVYYRCPGICSPLLTELSRIVEKMDLELGKDYQILTVSFDHREKPDIAAGKKENYLSSIDKPVDPNGWHFLTGDSVTIRRMTDGTGFYFMRSGDDYVHAGALIIVSPEGKITRYINGIQYLPFDVKMALIEAGHGRVGPTIAKVLQFCYSYDPDSRSYTFNVVRVAGVIIVGLVGVFVVVFLVKPKKKQREG
ncbi:MAG: SCO family protein [Ignavibacteria bacterium]|nr:SCO family protein [Ignavibacteria bacterium]